MTLLRLIHIVSGGFWAGAGILMGWFVAPAVRSAGPAAGPFMQALLRRRVITALLTAAGHRRSRIMALELRQPTMGRGGLGAGERALSAISASRSERLATADHRQT